MVISLNFYIGYEKVVVFVKEVFVIGKMICEFCCEYGVFFEVMLIEVFDLMLMMEF